jgi:Homeodomain-like domain
MGSPSRHTFDSVAEVIGKQAMLRLSLAFRGLRIFIPKSYNDQHPMVQAIGRTAADNLADFFGGTTMVVPSTLGVKAEVFRLADSGNYTRHEIAAQLYISERQVYRWLDERQKGRHQMDLFEPRASMLSIDS